MNVDDLFLDTMEDLRRRCDLRASEYEMVQVAGLLRRLVIDDTRLWVTVNRDLRLKPQCSWSSVRVATSLRSVPHLWLDPELSDIKVLASFEAEARQRVQDATRVGDLDEFLKSIVVYEREDARATVRELVKHYANHEGGVHYGGAPTSQVLRDLAEVDELSMRHTLLAIGRIIHRALEPMAATLVLKRLGQL